MEVVETSVVNALRICLTEKTKLTILRYLPSAPCTSLSTRGMAIFGVLFFALQILLSFCLGFFVGFLGRVGFFCIVGLWGGGQTVCFSVFVGFFYLVCCVGFLYYMRGGWGDHWFVYTISWRAANTSGKINAQSTIQNYTFSRKKWSINMGWKDIFLSQQKQLVNEQMHFYFV